MTTYKDRKSATKWFSEIPMKLILSAMLLLTCLPAGAQETLPPLVNDKAPQSFEEMWADFDARKEPLEIEILSSGKKMAWCCACYAITLAFSKAKRR